MAISVAELKQSILHARAETAELKRYNLDLLAKNRRLTVALEALWKWTKAEHEHFEAAMPDDFIGELVENALKEIGE